MSKFDKPNNPLTDSTYESERSLARLQTRCEEITITNGKWDQLIQYIAKNILNPHNLGRKFTLH